MTARFAVASAARQFRTANLQWQRAHVQWRGIATTRTALDDRHVALVRLEGELEHVSVLRMQRTAARNALGRVFMREFEQALEELREDAKTRIVVLQSTVPGVFCAGADLKERATMTDAEAVAFVRRLRRAFTQLEQLPMPTVAALNGAAFGGGLEMALAADLRVADASATMGLVETALAILPGAGGTQRLTRLVGLARAKELILLARRFSAADAQRYGLVSHVTSNDQSAYDLALDVARQLLRNGPVALRLAKQAVSWGAETHLAAGLQIEEACYAQVIPTRDRLEGLAAFREKRPPVYTGA